MVRKMFVEDKILIEAKNARGVFYATRSLVQLIDDVNGVTLASASSKNLGLANGGNIEASKAVGAEIAKVAAEKGITKVVFDRSGYVYHGRVQAVAEAARENGLVF